MSLMINLITFAGNLTRDPESRVISEKNTVCNVTLANNRRYKGTDGDTKEEVTFMDCEGWGKTAELMQQYLTKGAPLMVTGRLKQEQWQDKDGNRRTRVKIVIDQLFFQGSRPTERQEETPATAKEESPRHPRAASSSRPMTRDRDLHEAPF